MVDICSYSSLSCFWEIYMRDMFGEYISRGDAHAYEVCRGEFTVSSKA